MKEWKRGDKVVLGTGMCTHGMTGVISEGTGIDGWCRVLAVPSRWFLILNYNSNLEDRVDALAAYVSGMILLDVHSSHLHENTEENRILFRPHPVYDANEDWEYFKGCVAGYRGAIK